jgi:hypothetical protein
MANKELDTLIGRSIENKKIFMRQNIPVKFYYNNKSLRNVLAKSDEHQETWRKAACPISLTCLCHQKNVVYEVKCFKCSRIYIGSTIREFHSRVIEHTNSHNSSIYKHFSTCLHQQSIARSFKDARIRFLAHDSDAINLRIKEALLIRQYQAAINSSKPYV